MILTIAFFVQHFVVLQSTEPSATVPTDSTEMLVYDVRDQNAKGTKTVHSIWPASKKSVQIHVIVLLMLNVRCSIINQFVKRLQNQDHLPKSDMNVKRTVTVPVN